MKIEQQCSRASRLPNPYEHCKVPKHTQEHSGCPKKCYGAKLRRAKWEDGGGIAENRITHDNAAWRTQSDPDKKRRLPLIGTVLRVTSLNPRVPIFL